MHDALRISDRIYCLPVIHGSGDFAVQVRDIMLSNRFDCLAVPLPPSFQDDVERGVSALPTVTMVVQRESFGFASEWTPESTEPTPDAASYVPIDPCQPVIAAIRLAQQEHLPRCFIDLEVEQFQVPQAGIFPDPYALKRVSPEQFAAAVITAIPRPRAPQQVRRIAWMANQLRELEERYQSILLVCSLLDWPWLKEAYGQRAELTFEHEAVHETQLCAVDPSTLIFLLQELPYITSRYEEVRSTLDDDDNLSVDGIKDLLLSARERYQLEHGARGRKISPQMLRTYLKYVRNLSLVERRLTPDLYTLIIAAKQIAGDLFAIALAETAREYKFNQWRPDPQVKMSIDRGEFPNGDIVQLKNRLPGHPTTWRSCELRRRPPEIDQQKWAQRWNPFSHCSYPPEDVAIERFRTHVKDKALAIMGNDLARVEKFTSSIKDGLDIRETLRNWHTGDLYVKENPPGRGHLDCVIMLFETPADPRDFPWRITWHAEHQDESTLSFYATHYQENLVGPGIAMATYGGAMFLFPPRPVPDIWQDPRFDIVDTLEERLLIAACHHARERHLAILSVPPPGAAWKRLAKRYGKKLVHVPLNNFSAETVQQLRMFHVLNGREVRSYAEHFIRKA